MLKVSTYKTWPMHRLGHPEKYLFYHINIHPYRIQVYDKHYILLFYVLSCMTESPRRLSMQDMRYLS